MSETRLLSPFCVLSCNQSSSLFSGLLCRFRYSPVERFFYKLDGIDCCPKLNAKFVNRLIHRCWQLPPPINSATHCFFDSCYHLIDGDVAVGLCHSLTLSLGVPPPRPHRWLEARREQRTFRYVCFHSVVPAHSGFRHHWKIELGHSRALRRQLCRLLRAPRAAKLPPHRRIMW